MSFQASRSVASIRATVVALALSSFVPEEVRAECLSLEQIAIPLGARANVVGRLARPTNCVLLPRGTTVESLHLGRDGRPVRVEVPSASVIGLMALAVGRPPGVRVNASELPQTVVIRASVGGHGTFRLTRDRCVESMRNVALRLLTVRGDVAELDHDGANTSEGQRCHARLELVRSIEGVASTEAVQLVARFEDGTEIGLGHPTGRANLTPLQARFRRVQAPALLAWAYGLDGLTLAPRADTPVVDELRVAAAAEALQWRTSVSRRALSVRFSRDGQIVVPEELVRQAARARGEGAESVAPTPEAVAAAARELELCHVDAYVDPSRSPPMEPPSSTCHPLADWIATPERRDGLVTARLEHGVRQITSFEEVPAELVSDPPVSVSSWPDTNDRWLPTLATTGDRLMVSATGGFVALCTDGRCVPPGADGRFDLRRSGVAELRRAHDLAAAGTTAAVTVLRLLVIDPLREWIPVGLARAATEPEVPLWWQVPHDDARTFAFERGTDGLSSRWQSRSPLDVLPQSAVGSSALALTAIIALEDPAVDTRRRTPPSSRLVLLAARDARCPEGLPSSARRDLLIPDELALDDTFHLFLSEYRGEAMPYRCLAMARLRVREPRTLASVGVTRLAALGSPQVLLYGPPSNPGVGFALPIVYVHAVLPAGVGLDVGVLATASWSVSHGTLDRTGLATTTAVTWGIPSVAPRLVYAGVIGHLLQADVDGLREPSWSPFVGLNLGGIFEATRSR